MARGLYNLDLRAIPMDMIAVGQEIFRFRRSFGLYPEQGGIGFKTMQIRQIQGVHTRSKTIGLEYPLVAEDMIQMRMSQKQHDRPKAMALDVIGEDFFFFGGITAWIDQDGRAVGSGKQVGVFLKRVEGEALYHDEESANSPN